MKDAVIGRVKNFRCMVLPPEGSKSIVSAQSTISIAGHYHAPGMRFLTGVSDPDGCRLSSI